MKHLKINALLLLLALLPLAAFSQGDQKEPGDKERDDKVDKLKIAYITTELNLTSAEAEKFWPIYNELETKAKELRKANRKIEKEINESYETMTNEDAKKKMATIFENDEKETALRKEYGKKFSELLGDKRALKLLSLEHEFRRELLDRLKEQGPPPPPHPRHGNHGTE